MSTKIYNGMRGCLPDAFELGAAIRAVVEPIFFDLFETHAEAAYAAFDRSEAATLTAGELWGVEGSFGEKALRRYEVPKRLHQALTKLHNSTHWTMSELDFAYDVSLISNATGENPLVLLFGEQADLYRKALMDTGVVEPYPYWDNTDPEDGVSEEEWQQRSYAWTPVKDRAPSEVGLAISFPSAIASELALHNSRRAKTK